VVTVASGEPTSMSGELQAVAGNQQSRAAGGRGLELKPLRCSAMLPAGSMDCLALQRR
jgi:hypothetical protein